MRGRPSPTLPAERYTLQKANDDLF
jgi:hypothetical protein